jgi:hypothetical protein
MGLSNVEVANMALDHLGKDRIATLTESSTAARKINEVFDRTIHSALQHSPWTFSRTIQSLASLTNDWDERWQYKYDVPNNCLKEVRLVPTVDPATNRQPVPFNLMGGALYTNITPAKLEYVRANTDTSTMPQYFLDALSFLLARNVAMPLTRKRSYWNDLNEAYVRQLATAVEIDAGREPQYYAYDHDNEYLNARGATGGVENPAPDGSIFWDS